jgi:hypothetical protein
MMALRGEAVVRAMRVERKSVVKMSGMEVRGSMVRDTALGKA